MSGGGAGQEALDVFGAEQERAVDAGELMYGDEFAGLHEAVHGALALAQEVSDLGGAEEGRLGHIRIVALERVARKRRDLIVCNEFSTPCGMNLWNDS